MANTKICFSEDIYWEYLDGEDALDQTKKDHIESCRDCVAEISRITAFEVAYNHSNEMSSWQEQGSRDFQSLIKQKIGANSEMDLVLSLASELSITQCPSSLTEFSSYRSLDQPKSFKILNSVFEGAIHILPDGKAPLLKLEINAAKCDQIEVEFYKDTLLRAFSLNAATSFTNRLRSLSGMSLHKYDAQPSLGHCSFGIYKVRILAGNDILFEQVIQICD